MSVYSNGGAYTSGAINVDEETNMTANAATTPEGREVATLAGGCFWCLEAVYDELQGVESVVSGYMGGRVADPTYEQV